MICRKRSKKGFIIKYDGYIKAGIDASSIDFIPNEDKSIKLMIEKSELKAVITAPSGVFKPYAGVSTALLIFTKGGTSENVWFYDMESDGYTLDDKRKKQEGNGDLQDIVLKFKQRNSELETDRKAKHFFVPINK